MTVTAAARGQGPGIRQFESESRFNAARFTAESSSSTRPGTTGHGPVGPGVTVTRTAHWQAGPGRRIMIAGAAWRFKFPIKLIMAPSRRT